LEVKVKKERWLQTVPSFRNLKIDFCYGKECKRLRIIVTDLLDIEEKNKFSTIHNVSNQGGTYVITSIICPVCKKPVSLNIHWNSYICECKEHERKIFEICKVEVPDAIQKQTEREEMV